MRQLAPVWKIVLVIITLVVLSGCGSGAVNENGALLTSIEISSETSTLEVGATKQFTAIGKYDDNTSVDISNKVTWTSSDPSKATITAGGLATAVNKGTASITASLAYVAGATPLTVTITPAAAQWARVDVTADYKISEFYSVATASDGSVYAAGTVDNSVSHDFGNDVTTTGTPSYYSSTVLVRYDSMGKAQWAKSPVSGDAWFSSMTVAPDGSVYAAGSAYDTIDFGNGVVSTRTSSNGSDIVLVKYDSSGVPQWARTIAARPSGSGDSTAFTSVAVAADGSIYAAGTIGYYYSAATITVTSTYDFGNGVTVTGPFAGRDNCLLVKYDSSGNAQWAKAVAAGAGGSAFNGVTIASDGSVYAAGHILGQAWGTNTYDFGNSITAVGGLDGRNSLLVKYDSAGTAHWAASVQTLPGAASIVSGVEFSGVSVAPDGSVFAAGTIVSSGYFDFGNNVTVAKNYALPASDSWAAILVKYDPSGMAQWARTIASDEDIFGVSQFSSVSVAPDGSVYTTGAFLGSGIFDLGNDVTALATNYGRLMIAKYSSSGNAQWVNTPVPGANESWCNDVSAASDGSVYVAGKINDTDPYDGVNTYDFGNSVTATGNLATTFLLVKYQ